jgi:hypothetical protein
MSVNRGTIAAVTATMSLVWISYAWAMDFATPEGTLEIYINGKRNGDLAAVKSAFDDPTVAFSLPKPIPVSEYKITKRVVYGEREARSWNSKGIIPPAKVGDVELQVREVTNGAPYMFSYNFRRLSGEWKIYSHSAWNSD